MNQKPSKYFVMQVKTNFSLKKYLSFTFERNEDVPAQRATELQLKTLILLNIFVSATNL